MAKCVVEVTLEPNNYPAPQKFLVDFESPQGAEAWRLRMHRQTTDFSVQTSSPQPLSSSQALLDKFTKPSE